MSKSEDPPIVVIADHNDQSIDELAPFLQAWLFFGTLHVLFENLFRIRGFNESDFIDMTEDGSSKKINTTRLSMYIWYWAAWESSIPLEIKYGAIAVTGIIENIETVLAKLVGDDLRKISSFSPHHGITDVSKSTGHLVLLSIILLCEQLHSAMHGIYKHLEGTPHLSNFTSLLPRTLILRLEAAGWCPGQIQMLETESDLNCSTAYLLGSMEMAFKGKNHGLCTKARCRAYDVDYETYATKHVDVECQCEELPRTDTPELVSVSKALNQGELPLLWLEDSGIDRDALIRMTSCRLEDETLVPRYVAISHVWSDGMGNQERNAMPLCVLRKLQRQVNSLFDDTDEPVLFWIDTICVPKTNKVPALEIMAQTYAFATMVLVIDAGLESVSVESSPLERLIRIRTSPWFQRLWTLQEAWFARDLAFQFAEAACETEALLLECLDKPSPMRLEIEDMLYLVENRPAPLDSRLIRGLAADSSSYAMDENKLKSWFKGAKRFDADFPTEADKRLGRYINRFTTFDPLFWPNVQMILRLRDKRDNTVKNGRLKVRQLHDIFSALKNRQTSRKEDEAYCLANLMGIDVKPILAEKPADRMKKLLSLLPEIPATIIFSHELEHMDEEGFSWAPGSFMSSEAVSYSMTATSAGRILDKGLRICLPGLRMKGTQFSGPTHFEYGLGVVGDMYTYRLVLPAVPNSSVVTWNQFDGQTLMVIVRKFAPDQVGHNRIGDTMDGALVSFLKRDDGVDVVKFLTTVWITRTNTALAREPGHPLGEWLGVEHEWCVW